MTMTKHEAYKEWQEMSDSARKIERDPFLPCWQKAYKISGAYEGLALSELRAKHRYRVLNALKDMNDILAPYQFESFDDYHLLGEKEIQSLIRLAKQLAHR